MEYSIVKGVFDGYFNYPQTEQVVAEANALYEFNAVGLGEKEYKTLMLKGNEKDDMICYQHWKMGEYDVFNKSVFNKIK